jgi:hypothetical protein
MGTGMNRRQVTRDATKLFAVLLLTACGSSEPANEEPDVGASWKRVAEGSDPPGRWGHQLVFDARRNRAVLFGGEGDGGIPLGGLFAYSFDDESWSAISVSGDAPSPRFNGAAIADPERDRMLVFCGYDGAMLDEVWAFDFGTDSWSRLPSGPSPRIDVVAATDGRRAWLYGGFTRFGPLPPDELGDLWELDLETDLWQELPAEPPLPAPRTNSAFGHFAGALYLSGGHPSAGYSSDAWRYDVAARRWESIVPAGTRTAWTHGGSAVDDECSSLLYVAGDNNDSVPSAEVGVLRLGSQLEYVTFDDSDPSVARHHTAIALNPVERRVLMFGGASRETWYLGDTFEYQLGGCE